MNDINKLCDIKIRELEEIQTLIQDNKILEATTVANNVLNDLLDKFPTEILDIYSNRFNFMHWDDKDIIDLMIVLEKIEFFFVHHKLIDKNVVKAYTEGAFATYRNSLDDEVSYIDKSMYLLKGIVFAY